MSVNHELFPPGNDCNIGGRTLGKFMRPCRKPELDMSFRASDQDGFTHGRSGSCCTTSIFFWKSSNTQSMIRMMRWGGLASLRTRGETVYTVSTHEHLITVAALNYI